MLTHTYQHKSLRKIKVTSYYHQVDSRIYLWPDICFGDLQAKKKSVGHTWHWMSLPSIMKQYNIFCLHIWHGRVLYPNIGVRQLHTYRDISTIGKFVKFYFLKDLYLVIFSIDGLQSSPGSQAFGQPRLCILHLVFFFSDLLVMSEVLAPAGLSF